MVRHFATQRAGRAFFCLKSEKQEVMSALHALEEYSSDGSAAASNLPVLSDNSQDNSIDDDDCAMEAADAALPVKQKILRHIFFNGNSNCQS